MVQLQRDVSDSTIVSHWSEARGQSEIEERLLQEHNKQTVEDLDSLKKYEFDVSCLLVHLVFVAKIVFVIS